MTTLENIDRNIPILVVDDLATVRRVVKSCLRQLGFNNVTEASNATEALSLIESNNWRLVISDFSMPDMNGVELLEAVRSQEKSEHLPFLIVTADIERARVKIAPETEACEQIVKPFTASVLEQKLTQLL